MEKLLKNKKVLIAAIVAIIAVVAVVGIVIGVSEVSSKENSNSNTTVNPSAKNEETTYLSAEELVEKLDTTFQNTVGLKFEFSIEKFGKDSAFIQVASQGNSIMCITYTPSGSIQGIVKTDVDLNALGKEVDGTTDELQYVATCVAAIPTLVVMESQGGTDYTANDWQEVSTDLVSSLHVKDALTHSSTKTFEDWQMTLDLTDYRAILSASVKE